MERRTIAVDIDEVLGQFVVPLAEFHNERYGTQLSLADFHSYSFADVWGGTREESVDKVHKFFDSRHFENIPLIPGAFAAMKTLQSNGFDLVIVTSRQHFIEERTKSWIYRHFPGIFREVAFGNHWGLSGAKISKPDMCRALNASCLIDDNLAYTEQVAAAGMQAILFDHKGTYGWNKPVDKSREAELGIARVHGWDETVKILLDTK